MKNTMRTLTLLMICSLVASMSPVYTTQTTLLKSRCTSRRAVHSTRSPPPPALLFSLFVKKALGKEHVHVPVRMKEAQE